MDNSLSFMNDPMNEVSNFIGKLSSLDPQTWMKIGFIYIIFLWCAIVIWVIRDISARGGGFLWQLIAVLIVVFLTPILGLPLYLLIRPQYTFYEGPESESPLQNRFYEREEEKKILTCGTCKTPVEEDFFFCPVCQVRQREACAKCKKIVRSDWKICPYCGTSDYHTPVKTEEEVPEKKTQPSE